MTDYIYTCLKGEKMERNLREELISSIVDFKLPAYNEIPDVGLFLEQTTQYIANIYKDIEGITITSSMISNYVKKGLVDNPIKKQYSREQIAYLIFVAAAKSVVNLEDINLMVRIQKDSYSIETAYRYFSEELVHVLQYICGVKPVFGPIGEGDSDEKILLRNTVVTLAHKIYLEKCFMFLHKGIDMGEKE